MYKIFAFYQYAADGSTEDKWKEIGDYKSKEIAISELKKKKQRGEKAGYEHPDFWMTGEYRIEVVEKQVE